MPQAPFSSAIPGDLKQRMGRGRKAMLADAPKRRLCLRFESSETYWFLNLKGVLDVQSTVTSVSDSTSKPPHRIRNKYPYLRAIVDGKVSAATQRVPSYEIVPTSTDPDRIAAASLAEKVALYGYDKWRLREVAEKMVRLAVTTGDAYCMPYFDPTVGPYRPMPDGSMVGEGEVDVPVFTGNEVYWEAGIDFHKSRWWVIERARAIEDVRELPGFVPGTVVKADASASDIPSDKDLSDNLVMVTEYFERPSMKHPDGRCMTIANGKQIVDYRLIDPEAQDQVGPYPLRDVDDEVLDEPLIHRLTYTTDPEGRRSVTNGLVWHLIDFQRTIQDCWNKELEWKNRCLNPRKQAPIGSIVNTPDDVPGGIDYYRPGMGAPEWEKVPDVPQALSRIRQQAVQDMREIAGDTVIQADPNVAARTAQQAIEQNQNRWQSFLADFAGMCGEVMRHCLLNVALHYSEDRDLEIRGRDGWETIQGFRGTKLMDQTSVRVLPQSLVPITRQGIQETLTWIATTWPGWLDPQDALAALQAGSLDRIDQSYWLAVGRVALIIQKIRDGTVYDMPSRGQKDPVTGQPMIDPVSGQPMETPGYMPSDQDNLVVWKKTLSDWMQTDEYSRLPPEQQAVAQDIWDGIQSLQQMQAARQQTQQMQLAEQAGMTNAAKGPSAKPMPSQPAPQAA